MIKIKNVIKIVTSVRYPLFDFFSLSLDACLNNPIHQLTPSSNKLLTISLLNGKASHQTTTNAQR